MDISAFSSAVHLFPTVESVVQYNLDKLHSINRPIAVIKAIHAGNGAAKASSEDAGGLDPILYLSHTAHVMLIVNLWVEAGLVNEAMGTVISICYQTGRPPNLPLAVMVHFDNYTGPTLQDNTVPIIPIRRTWINSGFHCSRLQIPLRLAWAVTIHKSQGLTLDKLVIDIGKKDFSSGLTYIACSRVRHLKDLLFIAPFSFQRLSNLSKSKRLQERLIEDDHLQHMQQSIIASDDVHHTNMQGAAYIAPYATHNLFTTPLIHHHVIDPNEATPSPPHPTMSEEPTPSLPHLTVSNQPTLSPSYPTMSDQATPSPPHPTMSDEATPSPPHFTVSDETTPSPFMSNFNESTPSPCDPMSNFNESTPSLCDLMSSFNESTSPCQFPLHKQHI